MPVNKGGKDNNKFGKDRLIGKGKSDGKNNMHFMDFHTITQGFNELQTMYGEADTATGLSPSEVIVDCGASATAGGELAVQSLVAAVAAANPSHV